MRQRTLVILILTAALLGSVPAAAQNPDAKADLAGNAALKYWRGFALLPAMDRDEDKILQDWSKVDLNATALRLIDRSQLSRLDLHRGASLPRCDWGMDYEDGIRMRLPQAPKSGTLARLTALHARHEFEQGHWQAGAQDIADLLKLARHLEMDPLLLQRLVAYSITIIAIEAAAPYLPELKSALPDVASAVLTAPAAGPTLQDMVLKEKQISITWLIRELKNVERQRPGSWQDLWKEILIASNEGASPEDRDLVQSVKTFEEATTMLEDLLPKYDELAKIMTLAPVQFDEQYPEFFKKAKAANRMAGLMLPNMDKFVASERRVQTELALLNAALAVVQDGPDKLKDIKDPFGSGPFQYRALDKGFELKSKLLFKGQPLTLVVGQATKG